MHSAPQNPPRGWLRYKGVNITVPHHPHYSKKPQQTAQTAPTQEHPVEQDTHSSCNSHIQHVLLVSVTVREKGPVDCTLPGTLPPEKPARAAHRWLHSRLSVPALCMLLGCEA